MKFDLSEPPTIQRHIRRAPISNYLMATHKIPKSEELKELSTYISRYVDTYLQRNDIKRIMSPL